MDGKGTDAREEDRIIIPIRDDRINLDNSNYDGKERKDAQDIWR